MTTQKRSAREVWNKLVDEAGEDEIERAASVSVDQATRKLEAAGFDLRDEDASADAFLTDLASGALEERAAAKPAEAPKPAEVPAPAPERRWPPMAWLAAAASFALGVGTTYALLPAAPGVGTPSPYVPTAADLTKAVSLRGDAFTACDAQKWAACLADLDQARALDPSGDDEPRIKDARAKAIQRILAP